MRHNRLIILVLVITALIFTSACTKLKARDELNKGVKAFTGKNYEVAANHFKEALKLDPEVPNGLEYLAQSYMQQYVPNLTTEKNIAYAKSAIDTFEEVLKVNPTRVEVMQSIASMYNALGEYEKSKTYYQRYSAAQPENPVPLYGIGVIDWTIVNEATGNNGENVATMTPEQKAQLDVIADDGIEKLKRALQLNPKYAEALSYLNLCYRKKAMLTADTEAANNYTNMADRLAAQFLIMKKENEEEAAKKKKMF